VVAVLPASLRGMGRRQEAAAFLVRLTPVVKQIAAGARGVAERQQARSAIELIKTAAPNVVPHDPCRGDFGGK
jgi:hypothetical protein